MPGCGRPGTLAEIERDGFTIAENAIEPCCVEAGTAVSGVADSSTVVSFCHGTGSSAGGGALRGDLQKVPLSAWAPR